MGKSFTVVVEVDNDNNVVLAKGLLYSESEGFLDDPLFESKASARRAPGDKFDAEVGIDLALGRVLQKLGNRLERLANGKVKHLDDVREQAIAQKQRPKKKAAAKKSSK